MMLRLLILAAVSAAGASAEPWPYYIEPCRGASAGCRSGDPELAQWALQVWEKASAGRLQWLRVSDPAKARLRVRWATVRENQYGETRQSRLRGRTVADLFVLTDVRQVASDVEKIALGDQLYRDSIIFLTTLHEAGHALGLAHTTSYEDIMYSFAHGGDIREYFGRFRRMLLTRDDIPRRPALSRRDQNRLLSLLPRHE